MRPFHRVERVRTVEALQLHPAGGAEAEVAPGLDDLAHERRHQDLAATGLVGDPGREDDGLPEEIAVLEDGFAGVHADPDAQGVGGVGASVGLQGPHDLDRAEQRGPGARERQHEPVPLGLDLDPAGALDVAPHEVVVEPEEPEPALVAQVRGAAGGVLDVGEHDGLGPTPVQRGHGRGLGGRGGHQVDRGLAPRVSLVAGGGSGDARRGHELELAATEGQDLSRFDHRGGRHR